MNLHNFLHFNSNCPICREPLTLYLQWLNGPCFIAEKEMPYRYKLTQFKNKNDKLEDDHIDLLDYVTKSEIKFSSNRIAEEAKRPHMYFFYLCNPAGFKDIGNDYEINIYKGCYWRSTPELEFKRYEIDPNWRLEAVNPDENKLVNGDEIFSFKKPGEIEEKVYTLQLNYAEDKTDFMFYSVTEEQRAQKSFEPKLFDKTIPMLGTRPDFAPEHREKLLDRFDSWILVS